jgi:hypothetical protein
MAKKTKMPTDVNQRAAAVVAQATETADDEFRTVVRRSVHLKWTPEAHTLDFREPLNVGHVEG